MQRSCPSTKPRIYFAIAGFMLCCGEPALSESSQHPAQAVQSTIHAQTAPDKPAYMLDANISNAVTRQINADPAIANHSIKVFVNNGVVTLQGTMPHLLAKQRVIRSTELVRGVLGIVDQLAILPINVSDKKIIENIEWLLDKNLSTKTFKLDTKVENGKVTLSGNVASLPESVLAEAIASSVAGVKKIDNRIQIDRTQDRTDQEIKHGVEQTLAWDRRVDSGLISVNVKNGHVMLMGKVGSAAERQQAKVDARTIAGARSVDIEQLQVDPSLSRDQLRRDKYEKKSDDALRQAVMQTLKQDYRIAAKNASVSVNDGNVTLEGEMASLAEIHAAKQDANNTVGVRKVESKIQITPAHLEANPIKQNVEYALSIDPVVKNADIKVTVQDNIVTLYGMVDTPYEKATAETTAWKVTGVKLVNNQLSIESERAYSYHPYLDSWDINSFDWYGKLQRPLSGRTDKVIKEDIRSQLMWSPFIDANQVSVEVNNGVATLKGTVDSWLERRSAEENALEGGAVLVQNHIAVKEISDTANAK